MEYRDKPPYSFTEQGRPAGFLLKRTVEILTLARVDARYAETPVKRILQDVQANQQAVCSPSWYKLPEREAFALFSLPIHQDKPQVVLAHAAALSAVRSQPSLSTLLAEPGLSMGVVDGASYGPALDKLIAARKQAPVRAVGSPGQLVRMVGARRADFMLIDQEDLNWLDTLGEVKAQNLQRVDFADSPEGLRRYLMCSKRVDARVMERINQAIRQVVPELNP